MSGQFGNHQATLRLNIAELFPTLSVQASRHGVGDANDMNRRNALVSKKILAVVVAGAFTLNVMPLVAASSIAQAEPAGSMSNTPPNGAPDMKNQPDKTVVKQPATSADKKTAGSHSTPAK